MEILGSEKTVIATIALKGRGIIAEIKKRSDTSQMELTRSNRETILKDIISQIVETVKEGIAMELKSSVEEGHL